MLQDLGSTIQGRFVSSLGEPDSLVELKRALLSNLSLGLEERGFDDDMKQLFGSKPDETLWLQRQPSPCSN